MKLKKPRLTAEIQLVGYIGTEVWTIQQHNRERRALENALQNTPIKGDIVISTYHSLKYGTKHFYAAKQFRYFIVTLQLLNK